MQNVNQINFPRKWHIQISPSSFLFGIYCERIVSYVLFKLLSINTHNFFSIILEAYEYLADGKPLIF